MPDIRLIAMDIDGTLLNSRSELPDENLLAMRQAQEKGIVVAIASGRTAGNVLAMMREKGFFCPVIATNGAEVVDAENRVFFQRFMDKQAAQTVYECVFDQAAAYNVVGEGFLCSASAEPMQHTELDFADQLRAMGVEYLRGPENAKKCAKRNVYKFFVYNCADVEYMRRRLTGIPKVELSQSSRVNVEIMPEGVDKALGLRALAQHYNIPMENVMTLGDEANDIPMLKAAGYGVAMGNASRDAKSSARLMTKTNDECGVAWAIRHYAFNE